MRQTEALAEVFNNVRELITYINDKNISKGDIVSILHINGQIFLIYFG